MATVELTTSALDAAAAALAGKGAVHMINLVRYRERADYGGRSGYAPCSGREAYLQRYAPAFARVAGHVVPGETFSVVLVANAWATLVAPAGEAWDDIAIVEYGSFDMLRRIVESPEYASDAAPHRLAALADWRFIATTKLQLAG